MSNNSKWYELADHAFRVICPRFLEADDGQRKSFPEAAALMRSVSPIHNAQTAQFAINTLTRQVIPPIVEYRDGQITVPLKQAHWLLMCAIEIQAGRAIPQDYAGTAYSDLAQAMEINLGTV